MENRRSAGIGLLAALATFACGSPAIGDPPPQAPPAAAPTPAPSPHVVRLPEGTAVHVQFDERLSSATAATGDTFAISTDEPITLPDGTVIPAGYRGKGEVTAAEHRGMLGKPGTLNVRLSYLRIGDAHVHLRGSQGEEGKSGETSTIVLTVLFGPLGLLKHGSDIVIPKGQTLTAYVDEDADIAIPVEPPPRDD